MASLDPKAQDVIRCSVCSSAVELHCETCTVRLCGRCAVTHMTSKPVKKHEVVPFQLRSCKPILPFCQSHTDFKCELHCQHCDISVCSKCIASKAHKSHDMTEISEIFRAKKEEITLETEELEKIIARNYENTITEIREEVSKLPQNYKKLKESINQLRKEWHREADVAFDRIVTDVESMEKNDASQLQSHETNLTDISVNIRQTIQNNRDLLESNDIQVLNTYEPKIEEYRKMQPIMSYKMAKFNPNKIKSEQILQQIGKLDSSFVTLTEVKTRLTKETLLRSSQELPNVKTNGLELFNVLCSSDCDKVWASDKGGVTCITGQGQHLQSAYRTLQEGPSDMTINSLGELLFTIYTYRHIYVLTENNWEILIVNTQWYPSGICATSSGDLLVGLYDGRNKFKITRYNSTYSSVQELQFDQKGELLFAARTRNSYLIVRENRDGNILVLDRNARAVIALNQIGIPLFKYTGNEKSNSPFDPNCFTTDRHGCILITDQSNHVVHIIDKDGDFLHLIDNCNLHYPNGISIAFDCILWVGEEMGNIKLIKYRK